MFPPDPRVSALRQEGLHSLNYYHARGNCWLPRYLQRTALPLSAWLCQPPAALAVTRDFAYRMYGRVMCYKAGCTAMGPSSQDNQRSFALPFSSRRQPTHLPPAQNPISPQSSLLSCPRSRSSQPAVSVQTPPSLTQHYLFGWRRGEPRIPTASRPRARPACSVHPGFRQS